MIKYIAAGVALGVPLMMLAAIACAPDIAPDERPVIGGITCWFPDGTVAHEPATYISATAHGSSIAYTDTQGNKVVVGTAMCGASVYGAGH